MSAPSGPASPSPSPGHPPAPDYDVRPATVKDLPELARMRTALRDFLLECDPELWVISDRKQEHLAEFYAVEMEKDASRVLVATDDADRPVGMLLLRILESPNVSPGRFLRIDDAWVETAHRRRGVMRRLVAAAADFMEERDVEHAMLDFAIRNQVSEMAWLGLGFSPAVSICHSRLSTLRRAAGR